jgi:putative ABC transport system permease protein
MSQRLGLYARLSIANLRRHRARWGLTTFGVAIGVMSFTGVTAMTESIARSFERSVIRTAGKAELQVNNGTAGVDADLVDRIRSVPGVRAASGRVWYGVNVPALHRRLTIVGLSLGTDEGAEGEGLDRSSLDLEDELLFLARTDSVAVTRGLCDEAGWRIGSTFDVQGPTGRRTLSVRGFLHADQRLRALGDEVGVMDAAAAQRAFGKPDTFHWVDVALDAGVARDRVRGDIEAAIAGRAAVDTPLGRGQRMEAMLATLRMMLTLSGVVAMLVGIFLIYHTVATAVALRHEELGTLWALGAPRRQLSAYLLSEAGVVGLVGSVLGVVSGLGFAALAVRSFGDVICAMYAPVLGAGIVISAPEVVVALGFGLLAVAVGAAVPCSRALYWRDGEEAASGAGPTGWIVVLAVVGMLSAVLGVMCAKGAGAPVFALRVASVAAFAALIFIGTTLLVPAFVFITSPLLNVCLRGTWGILGTWTWLQVRKRWGHTAVTMGALAAGAAFALGITTLLGSYRHAFTEWINQTFVADIFVNAGPSISLLGGPTLGLDFAEEIQQLPGVRRVLPWRLLEVQFRGKPIIVQGMAEELIDRATPGVRLDHAAGDVVVSDTLAERYELKLGDKLALPTPSAALEVTIRAIVPDYVIDLGNVKIGWKTFVRYFGERAANLLLIDAEPGSDPMVVRRRIEELAGSRWDVAVLTQTQLHETVSALIDQSFALTRALEFLAVLVTICAMVNATSASIIDRGEELTTLRALGMLRGRVARLLMVEGGLVGLLGSLMGLVAGAVLGQTFVTTVARRVAGFRFAVHWPIATMAGLMLLSTAAAAGAALWVSMRSVRRHPVLDAEADFV